MESCVQMFEWNGLFGHKQIIKSDIQINNADWSLITLSTKEVRGQIWLWNLKSRKDCQQKCAANSEKDKVLSLSIQHYGAEQDLGTVVVTHEVIEVGLLSYDGEGMARPTLALIG